MPLPDISHIAPYLNSRSMTCNSKIPGEDSLLKRKNLRWVIVGEEHGTREIPAEFAYLVCRVSKSHDVIVGVEISDLQQADINDFMNTRDDKIARARFLKSAIWASDMKDGRSSEAYFAMLSSLRYLHQRGRVSYVVALQPSAFESQEAFERLMAEPLLRGQREGAITVALVGNLHARIDKINFGGKSYAPMAAYLPRTSTVTLDATTWGGMQWACLGPQKCGPISIDYPARKRRYGLHVQASLRSGYSGVFSIGKSANASPPMKSD